MEIVIKIPDELYDNICLMSKSRLPGNLLFDCLANGTPLPKGHGDLIDKSDLLTTADIREDGSKFTYVFYSEIDNAQTIISESEDDEE